MPAAASKSPRQCQREANMHPRSSQEREAASLWDMQGLYAQKPSSPHIGWGLRSSKIRHLRPPTSLKGSGILCWQISQYVCVYLQCSQQSLQLVHAAALLSFAVYSPINRQPLRSCTVVLQQRLQDLCAPHISHVSPARQGMCIFYLCLLQLGCAPACDLSIGSLSAFQ